MGIIYKITNLVNGKVYIGQTTRSLAERWRLHKSPRSYCRHLLNAIKHHGEENFSIEQIDQADTIEELNKKEREYIALYNATDRAVGYNLMSGGGNSHHSEETRLKLSKKSSQMWQNADFKKQMIEKIKKAHGTDESRKRHKTALLQRWKLKEYREKTIKMMMSDDYRKKQSDAKKRLHSDNDFHNRWREANKEKHGIKIECVETGDLFASIMDAANAIKRSDTSIRKVLAGVRKTAGGYHWRYTA